MSPPNTYRLYNVPVSNDLKFSSLLKQNEKSKMEKKYKLPIFYYESTNSLWDATLV
jgi:hypothetical protein